MEEQGAVKLSKRLPLSCNFFLPSIYIIIIIIIIGNVGLKEKEKKAMVVMVSQVTHGPHIVYTYTHSH